MLLAIDIGNSNIVIGCMQDGKILNEIRIATDLIKTSDQYCMDLKNALSLYEIAKDSIEGVIISSVVPQLLNSFRTAVLKLTGKKPMVVGPGIRTGLNIKLDDPSQIGSDLIVAAVAALREYPAPLILIDMGTATIISYISEKRSYEGGLMFPGVRVSLDALSHHTAQLPSISLQHPKHLIGKNTEDCMRSGIVYGTAGMLDGVIDRIREMLNGTEPSIVATGSNAPVIARYCRNHVVYDKYLLMEGLWAIYQKNCK